MNERSSDKSLFSLAQIQHLMRVEFNRAQRYGYPIACLMLGIDRIGPLRDMHGYEVKEEVVGGVADLLRSATRGSDFLGRFADDRLLAVVPHTNMAGVEVMARRLCVGAHKLRFGGDGRVLTITISVGASCQEPGGEGTPYFDALLGSAEDALLEAQNNGGDRVILLRPGAEASDH